MNLPKHDSLANDILLLRWITIFHDVIKVAQGNRGELELGDGISSGVNGGEDRRALVLHQVGVDVVATCSQRHEPTQDPKQPAERLALLANLFL